MSALYVFAFTDRAARPLRHGARRIEFIDVAGIHAAVERVSARPSVSEAALRAQHAIVMQIAASVEAILPARFGALLDREELEALVAMRREPIMQALQLVSGRTQMTVRVFTSAGAPESPHAAEVDERRTAISGSAYLEQRRRETAAPLSALALEIRGAVRDLVHAERTDRGHGRVDWTLYHLIDRSVVPQYEKAIDRLRSSSVVVTGPWPPFAFVPDLWA
jgi:hypothetical protein